MFRHLPLIGTDRVHLADARRPREVIALTQFLEQIVPDEEAAEAWLVPRRWPDDAQCAYCKSTCSAERKNRRPQPYLCHDCRHYFSVKTNSVTHLSQLSCRIWVAAVYLMLMSLNEVASTELARNLGINQKSAWHSDHRLYIASANGQDFHLLGPIEVDETYIGWRLTTVHMYLTGQHPSNFAITGNEWTGVTRSSSRLLSRSRSRFSKDVLFLD